MGPVLFIVAYIAAALTLAPAFLLTFAAGAVYGSGAERVLVYIGAVLGSSAVFGLASPLARSRLLRGSIAIRVSRRCAWRWSATPCG
jgi:uncharacterized membrane protein YdjX (TVP38/TMEM64 family)